MSLKAGDLKNLVYHIFEIDEYSSKLGDNDQIVTISFTVNELEPAKDLMNFFEKGYDFVLDSDYTPGEQEDGKYKVFVEISRNRKLIDNILELLYGFKQLTDYNEIRFRYYKNFKSFPATKKRLKEKVPTTASEYQQMKDSIRMENYKNFFNKSFLESIEMYDTKLIITKKYSEPLIFEVLDIGDRNLLLENINEKININSYPEILYLTKYIGDYNITKYGDKFIFENGNHALLCRRIN